MGKAEEVLYSIIQDTVHANKKVLNHINNMLADVKTCVDLDSAKTGIEFVRGYIKDTLKEEDFTTKKEK